MCGCPLIARSGKETDRRNLTLVDDTCTEINLTLWGDSAKANGDRWEGNPIVAFKGIKVLLYRAICVASLVAGLLGADGAALL